uniref:Uncharacterized protein n=1 Tax=Arundo donax TaxID=35708 RepID=A0A0A9EII8_ARUDO
MCPVSSSDCSDFYYHQPKAPFHFCENACLLSRPVENLWNTVLTRLVESAFVVSSMDN